MPAAAIYAGQAIGGGDGLSLYPLDAIQFRTGGGKDLISRDQWIIDGYLR
jgi:hypothetical protein